MYKKHRFINVPFTRSDVVTVKYSPNLDKGKSLQNACIAKFSIGEKQQTTDQQSRNKNARRVQTFNFPSLTKRDNNKKCTHYTTHTHISPHHYHRFFPSKISILPRKKNSNTQIILFSSFSAPSHKKKPNIITSSYRTVITRNRMSES